MKRRGDITFSFSLPAVGSGNLPRRRLAKITSRYPKRPRAAFLRAPEISSRAVCFRSFIAANSTVVEHLALQSAAAIPVTSTAREIVPGMMPDIAGALALESRYWEDGGGCCEREIN